MLAQADGRVWQPPSHRLQLTGRAGARPPMRPRPPRGRCGGVQLCGRGL